MKLVEPAPTLSSAEVVPVALRACAAVLAGGVYSAVVPVSTGVFFEGLLLVVTVALTLLVALATSTVQRADREFRVLQRLGDEGLVVVRRFAILGLASGLVAVSVGLANVGTEAARSLVVTAAAVVPAVLSTVLLTESLRLAARLFAPANVVGAIIACLPGASEQGPGVHSPVVGRTRTDATRKANVLEVLEGYGQALLLANDIHPYEVLLDGLARAERRLTSSTGDDDSARRRRTAEQLRDALVRMVLGGLDSPVFTRAGVHAFQYASPVAGRRLLPVLQSIVRREQVDGMVIREILRRGTEVATRRGSEAIGRFWAGALPVLASPTTRVDWDDRHLDHLAVSVLHGQLRQNDLRGVIQAVLDGWEDPAEGENQRLVQLARAMQEVAEDPERLPLSAVDAEVLRAKCGVLRGAGARLAPRALRLAVHSMPQDEVVDAVLDTGGLGPLVDVLITEWSNLRKPLEEELRRLDVDRRVAFATVIVAVAARMQAPWDGAGVLRRNLDGVSVDRAAGCLERALTRFGGALGAPAGLARLFEGTEAAGIVEVTHVLVANRRRGVRPGREHFSYLHARSGPLPATGADVRRRILVRAAQSAQDRLAGAASAPPRQAIGADQDTVVDAIRDLAAREDPDSQEMQFVARFLERALIPEGQRA